MPHKLVKFYLNSGRERDHQQLISIGAKDRAVFVWNVEHH